MSLLRGLLFENLGLKLVALLLSLAIFAAALLDRPVTLTVSFPVALQDLPDSLSVVGPSAPDVRAEIRGTGKQVGVGIWAAILPKFVRQRFNQPPVTVSLAGARAGHFERSLRAADLPLAPGVEVERLIGPRMLVLEIDRRVRRRLPAAVHIEWAQPAAAPAGRVVLVPTTVTVNGPERVVAKIDSVGLVPVRVDGKRDTVRVDVGPAGLPEGCTMEPPVVRVTVVLGRARP
jgi:hypothetical protein